MAKPYSLDAHGVARSEVQHTGDMPVQTSAGAPISDPRNSLTIGEHGPLAMDPAFLDKLAHFDRERIPERVVHAKGAAFYGRFEVTDDITDICKASVFASTGKVTRTCVRFSGVAGERGASDLDRDVRGFAIKFYTDEGVWDLVANNLPVFFIRDPMLFPDLIHSQKRHPKTDLRDADSAWAFFASTPESMHTVTMLFSDRGVPLSWRTMDGFGNHTFVMVNAAGERSFVKFHLKADAGIACLSSQAAEALRGGDTDFHKRDMMDFLGAGGKAMWTMYLQVIPEADAARLPYNIFDVTKVVPHADYPLRRVGKLILDEVPPNFFVTSEQVAFTVSNLVPGIEASQDRVLQGRMFSYQDTQRYRLGVNFAALPPNKPAVPVHNHQRDGFAAILNPGDEVPFHTGMASTGGPQALAPEARESKAKYTGITGRYDQKPANDDDDYAQVRELYWRVMTEDERVRLAFNIAGHLGLATPATQAKMLELFTRVHENYGQRVKEALSAVGSGSMVATAAKEPGTAPQLHQVHIKTDQTCVFLVAPPASADGTATVGLPSALPAGGAVSAPLLGAAAVPPSMLPPPWLQCHTQCRMSWARLRLLWTSCARRVGRWRYHSMHSEAECLDGRFERH